MLKPISVPVLCRFMLVGVMLGIFAIHGSGPLSAQPAIQRLNDHAFVDWSGGVIQVTGIGIAPADSDPRSHRRRLNARQAAISDAYRNLAESVLGVRISNTTTVRDAIANDEIRSAVQGWVRGARIVSITWEERGGDTHCEVLVEAPLGSEGGFASVILPFQETVLRNIAPPQPAAQAIGVPPLNFQDVRSEFQMSLALQAANRTPPVEITRTAGVATTPAAPRDATPQPRVTPVPTTPTAAPTPPPTEPTATITVPVEPTAPAETATSSPTGILFVARNLPYTFNTAPQVRTESQFPLYDISVLDFRRLRGLFTPFTTSIESAINHDRARTQPLIVEAIAVDGDALIVSNADGQRVIDLNRTTDILRNGRVVIVILSDSGSLE